MCKILVGTCDHYTPDVQAMLMAKYSRSYQSIEDRLPDTKESEDQHRESLYKYYVGYGHKSVSQLGSTTIWLEGVSQLAAKAIENHPLFNGQESSTRFINFSNQPFVSPNQEINNWQEIFRTFYVKALPLVLNKVRTEFPFESQPEGTVQTIWENTTKARAFDICRGLLPAGCTTNVAFTGTFDTINDHFGEMLYHPCQEMRDIAIQVLTKLKEKYPYASIDIDKLASQYCYLNDDSFYQRIKTKPTPFVKVVYDDSDISKIKEHLENRKKYEKAPRFWANKIKVNLFGELDFGSYRDIHRHRNGCIGMEVLGIDRRFHSFYACELTEELRHELNNILFAFRVWFESKKTDFGEYDLQYCVPMGFKVGVDYSCDINQAIYIMELRSGKSVHQTLRELVHVWTIDIKRRFPKAYNCKIYADMDKVNFSLRRGEQTFVEDV